MKRNLIQLAMSCKILIILAKLETSCQDLDWPKIFWIILVKSWQDFIKTWQEIFLTKLAKIAINLDTRNSSGIIVLWKKNIFLINFTVQNWGEHCFNRVHRINIVYYIYTELAFTEDFKYETQWNETWYNLPCHARSW